MVPGNNPAPATQAKASSLSGRKSHGSMFLQDHANEQPYLLAGCDGHCCFIFFSLCISIFMHFSVHSYSNVHVHVN